MTPQERSAVAEALIARHPLFARATVERWVADEAARYEGARIRTYVPLLVRRAVEATLRELAAESATGRSVPMAERAVEAVGS